MNPTLTIERLAELVSQAESCYVTRVGITFEVLVNTNQDDLIAWGYGVAKKSELFTIISVFDPKLYWHVRLVDVVSCAVAFEDGEQRLSLVIDDSQRAHELGSHTYCNVAPPQSVVQQDLTWQRIKKRLHRLEARIENFLSAKAVEIITVDCAALLDDTGKVWSLPRPARHYQIIAKMRESGYTGPTHRQGFILSNGRYVTRAIAMQYAKEANQIKGGKLINPGVLTSEDLW